MAIVKMSKFELFTLIKERKDLLLNLQKFSDVYFLKTEEPPEGTVITDRSTHIQSIVEEMAKVRHLIDSLEPLRDQKKDRLVLSLEEVKEKASKMDFVSLNDTISTLLKKRDGILSDINNLNQDISELSPWKSYDAPISELGRKRDTVRTLGIYSEKDRASLERAMVEEGIHFEHLGEKDGASYYFLSFLKNEEEEIAEFLRSRSLVRAHLTGEKSPNEEIENLKLKISDKKSELQTVERELKNHVAEIEDLEIYYEYLSNEKLKEETAQGFLETENASILEGYIPSEKTSEFQKMLEENYKGRYYLEITEAEKDDPKVPVALENNAIIKPFESLTTVYAMPKYNEIDPTPLLAPFYWFFFGMMAADLGYGLLLTIGTLIALKVMKPSKSMQLNLKFFCFLGVATMIWGAIYSSFFGGIIKLPWKPLLDSNNFNLMLVVSASLGLIHIFFGLGIKAYMMIRDGDPLGALYDVGLWYMALGGGAALLAGSMSPGLISEGTLEIVKWIMIVGMIGIVLFAARDNKNPAARLVWGAYSLYGISSYVGDVVSYSRLMALGLSGGFIAFAVNYICSMLWGGGIVGILFAVAVFIIFHLFNMFLSFLSGYVHTARLTYVEFFGKFYEGGGIPFRKFRSEPEYIEYK